MASVQDDITALSQRIALLVKERGFEENPLVHENARRSALLAIEQGRNLLRDAVKAIESTRPPEKSGVPMVVSMVGGKGELLPLTPERVRLDVRTAWSRNIPTVLLHGRQGRAYIHRRGKGFYAVASFYPFEHVLGPFAGTGSEAQARRSLVSYLTTLPEADIEAAERAEVERAAAREKRDAEIAAERAANATEASQ